MMTYNVQICAIDTNSTLFVCLYCWFGGGTCTNQCHFQFTKVIFFDKRSMHTRISSSGSYLKTQFYGTVVLCWV